MKANAFDAKVAVSDAAFLACTGSFGLISFRFILPAKALADSLNENIEVA
jgi:hypothetical protein